MCEGVSLFLHRENEPFDVSSETVMMMSLAARYMFFLSVWLMIANWNDKDILVGLLASALALWISLVLLPPTTAHLRLVPLAKLSLRFLTCSIIAGIDVARRALLPRLDLRPGFLAVPLTLQPGDARNAFLLLQSLQPGTLPTSAEGEKLQIHCLDVGLPIAAAVAADEALLKEAIGDE
jgi:multicomponent Na+:H+ antiporter subunit E